MLIARREFLKQAGRAGLYLPVYKLAQITTTKAGGRAPTGGGGALTFDTSSQSGAFGGSNGPHTWSHTVTTDGSNRAIFVLIGYFSNDDSGFASAVNYSGVSLTTVGQGGTGTPFHVEIWRLVNPATGANTVSVTMSSGVTGFGGCIGLSFTGVDQTNPALNFTTAPGNSTTPSVTFTADSGDIAIDIGYADANRTWTPGAGQTEHQDGYNPDSATVFSSRETGAGSTVMDGTLSGAAVDWRVGGCSVNAS